MGFTQRLMIPFPGTVYMMSCPEIKVEFHKSVSEVKDKWKTLSLNVKEIDKIVTVNAGKIYWHQVRGTKFDKTLIDLIEDRSKM